jgi:hypothetical protein
MSSNVTGFLIVLSTLFSTPTAGGNPPGYVDPASGVFSRTQLFALGSFHKVPLKSEIKIKHYFHVTKKNCNAFNYKCHNWSAIFQVLDTNNHAIPS